MKSLYKSALPLTITAAAPLVLTLVNLIPTGRGIWICNNAPFLYRTGYAHFGWVAYSWSVTLGSLLLLTISIYLLARHATMHMPLDSKVSNHLKMLVMIGLSSLALVFIPLGWEYSSEVRGLGISKGILSFGFTIYTLTGFALLLHIVMLLVYYRRFTFRRV